MKRETRMATRISTLADGALVAIALAFSLLLAGSSAAQAIEASTVEQRVADAVSLHQSKGAGSLCRAASDPEGPFQADEAYVFVFLRDGRLICHPRPDLNAMRAGRMQHVDRLLANAEARPSGAWTRYAWPHPKTLQLGVKSTFCRLSGRLVICAGGFFEAGVS